MAANCRINIMDQLQRSEAPGSIVVTDADGKQYYVAPGSVGQVLQIIDGVPGWADPAADVLTSLTVTGQTLTYTDEEGNATVVNIQDMETLTSLTENSDGTITYLDEDGNPVTMQVRDFVFGGTNITVTGTGTQADPFVISSPTSPMIMIPNGFRYTDEEGNVDEMTYLVDLTTDPANPVLDFVYNGSAVTSVPLRGVPQGHTSPNGSININQSDPYNITHEIASEAVELVTVADPDDPSPTELAAITYKPGDKLWHGGTLNNPDYTYTVMGDGTVMQDESPAGPTTLTAGCPISGTDLASGVITTKPSSEIDLGTVTELFTEATLPATPITRNHFSQTWTNNTGCTVKVYLSSRFGGINYEASSTDVNINAFDSWVRISGSTIRDSGAVYAQRFDLRYSTTLGGRHAVEGSAHAVAIVANGDMITLDGNSRLGPGQGAIDIRLQLSDVYAFYEPINWT